MTTATVYQELKLSEQLMSELNELRDELTKSEENLKSAIQDKMSVTKEYDLLMNKYLELSTFCESLKISNDNDRKDSQKNELKYSMLSSQNMEYKRLYRDLKKQTDELKHKLQEEKVVNDQLTDTKVQLENGNSILTMENQIMGEMLRKLYETIANLTGIHSVPAKLTQEFTELAKSAKIVADHSRKVDEGLKNAVIARDTLQADTEFMLGHRNSLMNEKDWIHKTYKQQLSNLQRELQDANDSRSKLADDLSKLEIEHRNLNVEYKLLLKRMRSMKKRAAYSQAEEKHCKNCAKLFIETENYNWSCRNHISTYSGEIWWCCGKTNKDAPGCKVSKHECKDDDADLYESEKNENGKYRVNICSVLYK
jgi:predicted  nucleic acid-binding Zn-ribbon protein